MDVKIVVLFLLLKFADSTNDGNSPVAHNDLVKMNLELLKTVRELDTRVKHLENMVVKLTDKDKYLNQRIDELETTEKLHYSSTMNTSHTPNRRLLMSEDQPVAFLASLATPAKEEHLGVNQNIMFDTVLTNLGGGFNVNHGIFTVPQTGVYLISATVLSWVDMEVHAALMVNGQRIVLIFGHGSAGRHEQGTQVAVLQLKAGDTVTVENVNLPDITIWGERFTSFTGVLLYPTA